MKKDEKTDNIKELAKKTNIRFNNFDIFRNAFVHRSYLNENPRFELDNNERLEFLGDAVLELVATEYLYNAYKDKSEGELTSIRSALVRGNNLSQVGSEISVDSCIYLSSGEKNGSVKARSLIIANCIEAIIGAIYIDSGYEQAKKFTVDYIISPSIKEIMKDKLYIDSKSEFQEKIQERYKITPTYRVLSEEGPDHNKKFISAVYINDKKIAVGHGTSKARAEEQAAKKAMESVDQILTS
jgi:ribonuclease-3